MLPDIILQQLRRISYQVDSYLWTYYHSIMIFQSSFSEFIYIKITILFNMSRIILIRPRNKIT